MPACFRRVDAKALLLWTSSLLLPSAAGCSGCTPSFRECPPPEASLLAALPERLSETGLYEVRGTERLAAEVVSFAPRYELWSDGAVKRRWIWLPPGAAIDTSDPDVWNFPVGTKLWKEFVRDGVRVETRLLLKHGDPPGAWTPMAYLWRDDDAWAVPEGVENARGTAHDIPSVAECGGCHGGTTTGVLGFSAVQLPARSEHAVLDLETLERTDRISHPITGSNRIPGDAPTRAALGYLHANCGHCHNQARPERRGPRCFDPENALDFSLRIGELDRPDSTATYRSAVGSVIIPGDPDDSSLMVRVRSRDPWWGMPALGTEEVDRHGTRTLHTWILGLDAQAH